MDGPSPPPSRNCGPRTPALFPPFYSKPHSTQNDNFSAVMTNAKTKLRARSLSIQIRELNEALTAHGDHILPSETINSHDIFDNVDSEITSIDMMK